MTEPRRPMLRRSHRVLIAVGIAALVGVIAIGVSLPGPTESTGSTDSSGSSTRTPTAKSTPDATTPGAAVEPQVPLTAPAPVPTAGARTSTEVEAAAPGEAAPPVPPEVASLLPGGIPQSKSEIGALVAGFPEAVPIIDGSTIVSSSIVSNSSTVQATVVASTAHSADDIIAQYSNAFAALGLPGAEVQSASGEQAIAFSRAGSSVTLSVGGGAQGSTYSLFAVIKLAG